MSNLRELCALYCPSDRLEGLLWLLTFFWQSLSYGWAKLSSLSVQVMHVYILSFQKKWVGVWSWTEARRREDGSR